jgi:hypothetical protein
VTGAERVESRQPEGPSPPPQPLRLVARLGLVARGLFYLLLAALALQLALDSGKTPGSAEANANGALTQVAGAPLGFALLAGAAVGFLAFARCAPTAPSGTAGTGSGGASAPAARG